MASPKPYYRRSNHRYLSGDQTTPIVTDSIFELDESDIWNATTPSPDLRKTLPTHRISKKPSSPATVKRSDIGGTASSLPVNVPDWSKILKEDFRRRRNDVVDDDDEDEDSGEYDGGVGCRIPPHVFLARNRNASFSVHEGIGRTLKGRDLSRVRNAIWEKIGFQD
ncbi:putative senescence regulator S40 [Helianthus anomalus]